MTPRMPMGWTDFPAQQTQQPQGGFVWGAGGAQLTPDQLADRMRMAQSMAAPDFSPVQHWTQGLGRVAQNVLGALDERSLEKQQGQAAADAQARITAALGKDADLAPLLTSNDRVAQSLGQMQLEQRMPKQIPPTEFERTLLGAGIDPASRQGQALYQQRAATMASPQPQFISDGMGGGRWVSPPATGIQGGGDPSLAVAAPNAGPQPGTIEDGYRFKGGNPADPSAWEQVQGGPTQPASGGFRPGV
jgi:hypothetical protein